MRTYLKALLKMAILKSEAARVQLVNTKETKTRIGLTLLCDGWEDAAGRSIYATVAAEVAKPPSCRFCWLS